MKTNHQQPTEPQRNARLGWSLLGHLGELYAKQIHAELVRRQLMRVGMPMGTVQGVLARDPEHTKRGECAELRELFRSLDQDARREFLGWVRYHLNAIFSERGTDRRWQAYVNRVADRSGLPCPGPDANAPEWSTFVLHIPRENAA